MGKKTPIRRFGAARPKSVEREPECYLSSFSEPEVIVICTKTTFKRKARLAALP